MPAPPVPRRRPPGRYDEPSRTAQRALAVTLGGLFLALVLAVVFSLYSRSASQDVRVQELGFSVLSDTAVRVDFAVTKPPGATAYCVVRSRSRSGAEAGRDVAVIGPSAGEQDRVVVAHVLTTVERAVTGEVPRCSRQDPSGAGGS